LNVKSIGKLWHEALTGTAFFSAFLAMFATGSARHCHAQAAAESGSAAKVVAFGETPPDVPRAGAASAIDPLNPSEIAKELAAMKARIELLEAELKRRTTATAPVPDAPLLAVPPARTADVLRAAVPIPVSPQTMVAQPTGDSSTAVPARKEKIAPFSDWDWTWLSGNPRNKDTAFDSKFFTPEIRADVTYTYDFNKPIDDSMGGSSELFRSNEIQLEQPGIGGDFHYDNVRARFMTQFGMHSTATIRNDPSYSKGQWEMQTATCQKHMAVTTLTRWTGSTSTPGFSCPTLVFSAITTLITGPTSLRMFLRTRRGFSRVCGSRYFPIHT